MKLTQWTLVALLTFALAGTARAQSPGPVAPEDNEKANASAPAPAKQDDPDADVNLAQPDFTLAALPTTLRLPRHKSSFRVTHRFGRPLGSGTFGDLADDFFSLDSGALIGLEYRFGLFKGTQIGIYRTSDRTIEFFLQRELFAQGDSFPVTIDALAAVEGTNNFHNSTPSGAEKVLSSRSPSLGAVISREVSDRAAFYLQPIWINNTNPLPEELVDDNSTFLIGIGGRVRIRPTLYLMLEAAPRVAGFKPDVTHISFGLEKRAGGHLFQLNFSNGVGTTLAQLARGGVSYDDWFLGFNISRKFF